MGRPPSFFNRSGNTGGPGILQNDGYQASRPRQLVINIPPIDPRIQQMIRETQKTQSPRNTKLQTLRGELRKRVEERQKEQNVLDEVKEKRRQAMEDVLTLRREEFEKTQKERVERETKELEEKQNKRKRAWRETMMEKFRTDLQEKKRSAKAAKKEEKEADKNEIETQLKTKKIALNAARQDLTRLNVQKVDMIWLLKTVIKAEGKSKAKSGGTSQEPKTHASKQA